MRTLYQTIKDTGNPDTVERNGPILCKADTAWLGVGYYFWEGSIDLAKHWGETHCNNKYMICQAKSEFKPEDIFDLINNYDHIEELAYMQEALLDKYKDKDYDDIPVCFVIEYLKSINAFVYKAVRATAINSFGRFARRIPFIANSHIYFMESKPAWQVCVIDKSFLIPGSYKVIYPEEYIADYAV